MGLVNFQSLLFFAVFDCFSYESSIDKNISFGTTEVIKYLFIDSERFKITRSQVRYPTKLLGFKAFGRIKSNCTWKEKKHKTVLRSLKK